MLEVALLLLAAAVADDEPPPWPPQDYVYVVQLIAGGPVAVKAFSLEVEVGDRSAPSPEMKVAQTYELDPSHGPLRVALASQQAGEDRVADSPFPGLPYGPESWGALGVELSADGKPLNLRAVTEVGPNRSETRGHLSFEIPSGARKVVLHYRTRVAHNQDQDFIHFRPWAFSSWGAPPGRFDVTVKGIGDLPATHVEVFVRTGDTTLRPHDGPKPAWTFARGTLELHGIGRYPPTVVVVLPYGLCARRDCQAAASFDDLEDYCRLGRECSTCASRFYTDYLFENWRKETGAGLFDRRSLLLARNWIYARHGQVFETPWLKQYFAAQPWYCPSGNVPDAALTPAERSALVALRKLEAGAPDAPRQ